MGRTGARSRTKRTNVNSPDVANASAAAATATLIPKVQQGSLPGWYPAKKEPQKMVLDPDRPVAPPPKVSPLPRSMSPETSVSGSEPNTPRPDASARGLAAPSGSRRPRREVDKIRASANFHTQRRVSPLDSEAPPQNFRGLYNLAGLILVIMNARLVVENLLKYGLRFQVPSGGDWDIDYHSWPCATTALAMSLSPMLSWAIESGASGGVVPAQVAVVLHSAMCLAVFTVPIRIIQVSSPNILSAVALLFMGVISTMKLISYAHVCHDIRREVRANASGARGAARKAPKTVHYQQSASESDQQHTTEDTPNDSAFRPFALSQTRRRVSARKPSGPEAVLSPDTTAGMTSYSPSIWQLYYFMVAPTLVYQESYPRSERIRVRFVIRRVAEVVFLSIVVVFFVKQYMVPVVGNTVAYLDANPDAPMAKVAFYLLERLFKLAVPNAFVWLCLFYIVFHSYLNLLAELLRFGDRQFYKDWWNAESLDVYWRNWNLPVHNWLVRHVYAPALRAGLSKLQANAVVFLLSAVMHEVLVSIPCQMNRSWAFLGMLAQLPLITFSRVMVKRFHSGAVWGNMLFWTTFLVFGQPAAVMLYYYSYVKMTQL